MPRPGPLQVQPERRGQREHPQRVGGRRAVHHDVVPLARGGQLADLVQAEHLLNAGQRRKFFGGNVSQIRFGKPAGEQAGDLPPPRLQQRQRVQGQRVEEPAAGVAPGIEVGEHPGGLTHARSA